ncbi:DHS-like NAD/FAD-binding protein [Glarea lozoyensis ATCC 20868]|uniref:DHS-like NAD/FAD-binding protein n=2 Tax=Glarea lozoyensis TaxID=101852 RepID=S3DRD3_GLAL2|nr:DHS-like NAD/FAD-binding protein [Glarea lozoyensis ATCC 20868]EPE29033.1 DHS-like NAD/FAD-binding protein [Glarea lozoyensis ATCC 20868]
MDANMRALGASSKLVLKGEHQSIHQTASNVVEMGFDSSSDNSDAFNLNAAAHPINSAVEIPTIHVSDDAGSQDGSDEDGDEWAIESIFEDSFPEMEDNHLYDGTPNTCTYEEAMQYRQELRDVGPEVFIQRTIDAKTITAKKLLTAFGMKPPEYLEMCDDDAYYSLLSLAISRELSKRVKLPAYNSVDDAVELIKKSSNIIVLTGAGISTSLGIPDFRSAGTGLYSKLAHLDLNDPQEVFDISKFRENPKIFYSVARDLITDEPRTTPTHAFIALLQQKGKLLTNYSQNIDNIEATAGILPEKLVQCHGSFATASCIECRYQVPGTTIYPSIRAEKIPQCPRCIERLQTSKTSHPMKRKRSSNGQKKKKKRFDGVSDSDSEGTYDIPEPGVMKPDITFFGEPLPDRFSDRLTNHDKDKVDLVIVIGTSLKVAPVSEVVPFLPPHIPQMYISREPVSHVNFDVDMLGDCDVVVAELCERAGWELKHEMIPKDQKIEVETVEGFRSRHRFTVVK